MRFETMPSNPELAGMLEHQRPIFFVEMLIEPYAFHFCAFQLRPTEWLG
jgi:hypothetical protein